MVRFDPRAKTPAWTRLSTKIDEETWASGPIGLLTQARAAESLPASTRRVSSATVWNDAFDGLDHCDHPAGSPVPVPRANRSSVIAGAAARSGGPTRRLSRSTSPAALAGRANPTCPGPATARSAASTATTGCRVHFPSGPRYWLVSPRWSVTRRSLPTARTVTVTHLLLM